MAHSALCEREAGGWKSALHGSSLRVVKATQEACVWPHRTLTALSPPHSQRRLPHTHPHHLLSLTGPDQLVEEQLQHSLTVEQPTPAQGRDTGQGLGAATAGPLLPQGAGAGG